MAVLDRSALVAYLRGEPHRPRIGAVAMSSGVVISTPNLLESEIVLEKHFGPTTRTVVAESLQELGATVLVYTNAHADLAFQAFERYGKGRPPASLNYGDCMAYCLAKSLGAPLLYAGEDFSKTDITSAL